MAERGGSDGGGAAGTDPAESGTSGNETGESGTGGGDGDQNDTASADENGKGSDGANENGTAAESLPDRVLVLNPESGDADHRERVRDLARDHGFTVLETQEGGEAVRFAALAASAGADLVAAAGGDGTLNEVARGIDAVGGFDDVTFAVVPCGTGNNFAGNVGVEGIDHAFEVIETGERRRVDVASADGRLFLNSCVAGVTADASASTTPAMKERFGVLAYVVSGLRSVASFDGLPLAVEATCPDREETWAGEAVTVLVGNARRFPVAGRTQANAEDGLLDVTIVERMPPAELLEEAAIQRLFGEETQHVTRLRAAKLRVEALREDPVEFSFDGEMGSYESVTMTTRPRVLELCVGENYEPTPE